MDEIANRLAEIQSRYPEIDSRIALALTEAHSDAEFAEAYALLAQHIAADADAGQALLIEGLVKEQEQVIGALDEVLREAGQLIGAARAGSAWELMAFCAGGVEKTEKGWALRHADAARVEDYLNALKQGEKLGVPWNDAASADDGGEDDRFWGTYIRRAED